jgi:hypothetical protein
MGLAVTSAGSGTWIVTGLHEHEVAMLITQEMKLEDRPNADYFE